MAGSRWRIGTGESVKIIGQPWLLDEVNPLITTESQSIVVDRRSVPIELRVCIDKDLKC